ncbi:MAG: sodium:proline symporter [Thermonema sp.]|uniref:sodium:solute symporter family protein n=1 Tax=Thermonema sp. TaxID=2231181 RepID=UPI0021DC493A|nr:sodium:solute symporter family protein [Thermonema sp.]GIV38308.1 MAG: sodium:proline symporter [Thermonema sp.]
MHWIDITIFCLYLLAMLGVGIYFSMRNHSQEDYYVGGRKIASWHIGLSVVATDVGGGFSIGLGGLGFLMGLAGSWMLFTGLLGAWLSAVFLIPKVYPVAKKHRFLSFPEVLKHYYTPAVALVAAAISLIGYIGFTSSQILAGAKLAAATFPSIDMQQAVWLMGSVVVVYTVLGGLKAVIYTDTVQWIILMAGLLLFGIPLGIYHLGGWQQVVKTLPPHFMDLSNLQFIDFFNWLITIVPIWFVGMTLYQRIYAARSRQSAQKAWFIAGLFEWPLMAFMGVMLGLLARAAYEQNWFADYGFAAGMPIDEEIGLPLLLVHVFPVGFMGLLMASYFSAIMSTADSCLMAASGNFVTDVMGSTQAKEHKHSIRYSQLATLLIGALAVFLATQMQNVLSLMLHSYSFMVSGLLVPVLGALFLKRPSSLAAMVSMILGGSTTLLLSYFSEAGMLLLPWGLDANFWGIGVAALAFTLLHFIHLSKHKTPHEQYRHH